MAVAEDYCSFLGLLARYRQRTGLRLFHYCLMSNPFHLLLQMETARQLSAFMAGLFRSYVHHFICRWGFVGHLWQGRFKSPVVQTEGYLLSCGRYIERNPVEANLVTEPWQYAWSSAQAYALGVSDALLAENPWYAELAPTSAERQEQWRAFLLAHDPCESVVHQGDWAVGDEAFRQRMQAPPGTAGAGAVEQPGFALHRNSFRRKEFSKKRWRTVTNFLPVS